MRFQLLDVIGVFGFMACLGAGIMACSGDPGSDGAGGAAGATGPAGTAGTAGPAGAAGPVGPAAKAPPPPSDEAPKALYTLSNDATSNAVVVYNRAADGTLTPLDTYITGGRGSASGLGNQGALIFDKTQKHFFAVNAGDDSISMMTLASDGHLTLVSKIGAGGAKPVSLSLSGDVLYVLNAGSAATPSNIAGFKVSTGGLTRIANASQPLSAATPGPAQISFTPDGARLVVTEKGTNVIDTYLVTGGVAGAPTSQASVGTTPFGFAFSASKQLLVSEAFGGADGAGAASSYVVDADGLLTAKSSSVGTGESAPCWVRVIGVHAYVTNTKSSTISTYTVADDGTMSLFGPSVSGTTGKGPIDVDATDTELFTLNGGDHSISRFAIAADGSLTKRPDFAGLPEFANGLVVR